MGINVNYSPDLAVLGAFAQQAGLGEYRERQSARAQEAAQRAAEMGFRERQHRDSMAQASWQADLQNRQFMNQQYMQRMQFGEESARNRALFGLQAARQQDDIAFRQSQAWQGADQQEWNQQYRQAQGALAWEKERADYMQGQDVLAQKREHDNLMYGFGGSVDRQMWGREGMNEDRIDSREKIAAANREFQRQLPYLKLEAKEKIEVDRLTDQIEQVKQTLGPVLGKAKMEEIESQITEIKKANWTRNRTRGFGNPNDESAEDGFNQGKVRDGNNEYYRDPSGKLTPLAPQHGIDKDYFLKIQTEVSKMMVPDMDGDKRKVDGAGKPLDRPLNPEERAAEIRNRIKEAIELDKLAREGIEQDIRDPVVKEIKDIANDAGVGRAARWSLNLLASMIEKRGSWQRMKPAEQRRFDDIVEQNRDELGPDLINELYFGDGKQRVDQIKRPQEFAGSGAQATAQALGEQYMGYSPKPTGTKGRIAPAAPPSPAAAPAPPQEQRIEFKPSQVTLGANDLLKSVGANPQLRVKVKRAEELAIKGNQSSTGLSPSERAELAAIKADLQAATTY